MQKGCIWRTANFELKLFSSFYLISSWPWRLHRAGKLFLMHKDCCLTHLYQFAKYCQHAWIQWQSSDSLHRISPGGQRLCQWALSWLSVPWLADFAAFLLACRLSPSSWDAPLLAQWNPVDGFLRYSWEDFLNYQEYLVSSKGFDATITLLRQRHASRDEIILKVYCGCIAMLANRWDIFCSLKHTDHNFSHLTLWRQYNKHWKVTMPRSQSIPDAGIHSWVQFDFIEVDVWGV